MKLNSMVYALLLLATQYALAATPNPAQLPSSWYQPDSSSKSEAAQDLTSLSNTVDRIYGAHATALSGIEAPASSQNLAKHLAADASGKPRDWAPWHLEFITSELALTAQGLIGALTVKGTPGIQLYWRRQGTPPASPQTFDASDASVTLSEKTTVQDIQNQLEPVVKTAEASGQVKDTSNLRENISRAATQLHRLAQALESTDGQGTSFWVSGFRFDFTLDEGGNVFPIGTKGGDIRFRFEWKRLKRKTAPPPQALPAMAEGKTGFEDSLIQLARTLQLQLDAAVGESDLGNADSEFKIASYRVGIGLTKKGKIGIAQGSATLTGHLNFSSDTKKPIVYPRKDADSSAPVLLLGNGNGSDSEPVYSVNAGQVRKGLVKAMNIGKFFARTGPKRDAGWKIYLMKAGFDMSLSGDSFLSGLTATGTSELTFYNQKF